MHDQHDSIWARTTMGQQLCIFAAIFIAAIVALLWATK
jgi:hypothetical protein